MTIPLRAIVFSALFGLVFALFGWSILFYSDWFIPESFVSWFAGFVAVFLAFWVTRTSPLAVHERRHLVKFGAFTMLAFLFWLFFAQTVPSVMTRLIGSTHHVIAHVSQHYWSTRTCQQRLVLREFNPPFGGFCQAPVGENRLQPGTPVLVVYDQSFFGRFVLHFENER